MSQSYSEYVITLTMLSSFGTPLQADTLFGHICWAVKFLDWNENNKLTDFLDRYENETTPPLLISNGFPEGYIAKPIIPPVTQKTLDELFRAEERIENAFLIKSIKKAEFVPLEVFRRLQTGSVSPRKLLEEMKCCIKEMIAEERTATVSVQHNTIDRIKGSVRQGGLFSQEETFFGAGKERFTVYLKSNYFTTEDLTRIFHFISESGYGRDKSTGKGYFTFEIKEGTDLSDTEHSNAFMTLSSYIPKESDPTEGYYNIIHKFGKLGGTYAKGISEVSGNPFKVPLIMFSAGSVFHDREYAHGKVYGSLLKEVHHNKDIRHYAYAFPIGVNIEVNNEDI